MMILIDLGQQNPYISHLWLENRKNESFLNFFKKALFFSIFGFGSFQIQK